MKDRIKNLLASGLKPVEVCSVVGCSPAYVAQLWADPEFKQDVENLAIANAQEKTEDDHLDTRYQNLEHKIITGIEQDLPNADFKEKLRALEIVSKRAVESKRSKMPVPLTPAVGAIHITNIGLPAHALERPAPVVEVNEKNEIIAIDHKPMAPMSSEGVKNIFKQIQEARQSAQKVLTEI